MANEEIKYRKTIRQRLDATALHVTEILTAGAPTDSKKLDIVARKVTVQLEVGLTANVLGSVDGKAYFTISAAATGFVTYGDTVGDNLVKWIRVTRTAGTGRALILGA